MEVCRDKGLDGGGAMAALRRYELEQRFDVGFDKLSGGQQARLQILLLELGGSTLLALDEPTDNLDVASAEALERALAAYAGTVVAAPHRRWVLPRGWPVLLLPAGRRRGSGPEVHTAPVPPHG